MTQGKSDTSAAGQTLRRQMKRTFDPRVIDGRGNLHGLFRLDYGRERLLRRNYKSPVLVTRTAGLAPELPENAVPRRADGYETAAFDVVARCINDLVATGAEPLMFVPHIAIRGDDATMHAAIVKGLADGCVEAGCAMLAGDTVQMAPADASRPFDLTGFALGVVNENRIIDGSLIRGGDVMLGLASADRTRIYAKPIQRVLRYYRRKIAVTGMVHITTGFDDALRPLLPPGRAADVADAGPGVAYVLIVRPKYADSIARQLKRAKEKVHRLGTIV